MLNAVSLRYAILYFSGQTSGQAWWQRLGAYSGSGRRGQSGLLQFSIRSHTFKFIVHNKLVPICIRRFIWLQFDGTDFAPSVYYGFFFLFSLT